MRRICIYPSDVAEITGKSISSSRQLIRTIKDVYGKRKHQPVTIKEFCEYEGFPYEEVYNIVNKIPHEIKQNA